MGFVDKQKSILGPRVFMAAEPFYKRNPGLSLKINKIHFFVVKLPVVPDLFIELFWYI